MQEFIGTVGFDRGGNDLTSRTTHPASMLVIADWVKSVTEHYQGEMRFAPSDLQEVRIDVWSMADYGSPSAMPVDSVVIRSPYLYPRAV